MKNAGSVKEGPYQQRYLEHQKRKKKLLEEIIEERHSERKFGQKEHFKKIFSNDIFCGAFAVGRKK